MVFLGAASSGKKIKIGINGTFFIFLEGLIGFFFMLLFVLLIVMCFWGCRVWSDRTFGRQSCAAEGRCGACRRQ